MYVPYLYVQTSKLDPDPWAIFYFFFSLLLSSSWFRTAYVSNESTSTDEQSLRNTLDLGHQAAEWRVGTTVWESTQGRTDT